MTRLTALPARFRSPLAIVGEVARTVLAADMARASRLFTILGEVARISGVLRFSHWFPHFQF